MTKGRMNGEETDAAVAALVGDLPAGISLEEGAVVPMRDHDGEVIWIKIRNLFESKSVGVAVTGYQYKTEECQDIDYIGTRDLPLTSLVDLAAETAEKREKVVKARTRKTGGGVCEHCGERTGGGRFLPGHDAKLKSMLMADGSIDAMAEQLLRNWTDWTKIKVHGIDPKAVKHVKAAVAQGDGFLRSRIAGRIGTDPGRKEEIA